MRHAEPLLFLPLLLAAAPVPQEASETLYSVAEFPPASGQGVTQILAIDDRGRGAGLGLGSSGWFEGNLWDGTVAPQNFRVAYGYESSTVGGLNTAGDCVGSASVDPNTTKDTAFLKPAGQAPVLLPQLVEDPLVLSVALGVTPGGLVAGKCDTVPTLFGNPQTRAVLWEDGAVRNLGTLGGDLSVATALADPGVVVGISNLSPGNLVRAFRWTEASGMLRLPGVSPALRTIAADVNAAGVVVGDADTPTGRVGAMWPDPATLVQLPTFAGDLAAESYAINEHGQIVGRGTVEDGLRARLWQGGVVYDLDDLTEAGSLTVVEAQDVNERGQILATAFDYTLATPTYHVLLLTPDRAFRDLGQGLAGAAGVPLLRGYGNFLPDGPVVLSVEDAAPNALAVVFVGFAPLNLPLLGGTLVPDFNPPGFFAGVRTDASGSFEGSFTWPAGLPSGTDTWYQVWVIDAGAPQGVAATNALRAKSP